MWKTVTKLDASGVHITATFESRAPFDMLQALTGYNKLASALRSAHVCPVACASMLESYQRVTARLMGEEVLIYSARFVCHFNPPRAHLFEVQAVRHG